MLLTIGLIISAFSLLYLYLTWNFEYWQKRGIPGPKPTLLVGNFKSLLFRQEHGSYEMDRIYREYKTNTNFVGTFRSRKPRIFVLSASIVKDILVKHFKNFHDNEFATSSNKDADPLFGRNPFMLSGEEWKNKRGEITPAFTSARMKSLFTIVAEICSKMTTYIIRNGNVPLEGRELSARFTTDVVSSCIFAADAQSFTAERSEIREHGRKLIEPSLSFMFKAIILNGFPKLANALKVSLVPKAIEEFFTNLMQDALKFRRENNIQRVDYLDYLINLRNKKEITDVDMAAHGVTFFIDGFETSSIAMSFVLYELAVNHDVQHRLREEIQSATTDTGNINYDTLLELSYLDQIINETLRLWPPAPFMSKVCTEPIELDFTANRKTLIEKNVSAIIPIWCIHRDAEYYEEPERFNPDRFDPASGGVKRYREKGCFMPFGDGPRQCLGMRFALMLLKRGIYEIVKHFNITLDQKTIQPLPLDRKHFLTLPEGGIWLRFERIYN